MKRIGVHKVGLDTRYDVCVISCYGRGHYLAALSNSLGLNTILVDISAQLGRLAPEDASGPFGVFTQAEWTSLKKARLSEEDALELVHDGFSLWLKNIIIDTMGPRPLELLEAHGLTKEIRELLVDYAIHGSVSQKALQKSFKKLLSEDYSSSWFLHFVHQIASNVYQPNHQGALSSEPLSVFSPHFVQHSTRRGFERSLEWLEAQGVRVLRSAKIKDIAFQANFVQGLEVEGEYSGVLIADQYVWGLSSLETEFLNSNALSALYPNGKIEPEWFWTRYRLQIRGAIAEVLPKHFFVIDDKDLTWTHENLLSVFKTPTPDKFDVWLRLPHVHRFQREYLQNHGQKAREVLLKRLPGCELEVTDLPAEYHLEPYEIGPVRYPIFSEKSLLKHKFGAWINLHLDSPELWTNYSWDAQFKAQDKIGEQLATWKKDRDERRKRLAHEGANP